VRASIRQRSKGTYEIRFDLPTGPDGRRRQKSITFRGTKREAEREAARLVNESSTGTFAHANRVTVKQFLEEWLKTAASLRVSAKTLQGYEEKARNHLVPHLGHLRLDRLTTAQVEALWLKLQKHGPRADGREGGLHPRTILHCHRVLHTALESAVKKGLLTRNPASQAEVPRQTRAKIQALDEAQLRRVLAAARGTQLYVPILLSATTAMRRGEVCALKWADVDLDGAAIAVQHAIETTRAHGVQVKGTKSGEPRVIAMPAILVTELRRHKAAQASQRLTLGSAYQNSGLIVANDDGTLVTPNALTAAFHRFIRTVDVPRISFNGLRHSAATLMLGRNVGVPMVQNVLGHSTPLLTIGTYGHALKPHQQEAARQIDLALQPTPQHKEEAV
jgi:integrase